MKRMTCIMNPLAGLSSEEFLLLFESSALGNARLIHDGRNKLWEVVLNSCSEYAKERKFVTKKFNSSLKNRIIYSVCSSKARKSYQHALILISRGVHTPMPCGYLERRSLFHLLLDAFYVSFYEDSISLGDYLDIEGRKGLKEFAQFMAIVHESGIRHDDLNRTNVRVKCDADKRPVFSFIDLNRMKIYDEEKEVPLLECLKNLCRFSDYDPDFIFFIETYLQERGLSREWLKTASTIKLKHNRRVDTKRAIKKLFAFPLTRIRGNLTPNSRT